MQMVYKNEKPLFGIALGLSLIVWIALVIGTVGIALIWGLIFFLIYLFAQSSFISYIKGTGVKISAHQYADLHRRLVECANKLGLDEVPDCYVLRTDTFNALATKFLGQHFVVLFSDVVDALKDDPDALNFYIGHELGHIHRKHLQWSFWLAPGKFLPLLGAAYSRACEYTCDRYGLACCESPVAAQRGLLAIGAGDSRFLTTDVDRYIEQSQHTNEFWMSFHELTGTYPWLIKRTAAVKAAAEGGEANHPRRHFMSWVLSIFVPNAGVGGAGSILVVVAIVGILAAIALPAYQDYTVRAHVAQGLNAAGPMREAVTEYAIRENKFPQSELDLGAAAPDAALADGATVRLEADGVIIIAFASAALRDKELALIPYVESNQLQWRCQSETIADKQLPQSCRSSAP